MPRKNKEKEKERMREVQQAELDAALKQKEQDAVKQAREDERDEVYLPLFTAIRALVQEDLAGLDNAMKEVELFAAFHEMSERETALLNLLKGAKKILGAQFEQINPEFGKLKARREVLGAALRVGYRVGATKIRALPENHPMSKELKRITEMLRQAQDHAFAYIDKVIDEQKAVCESGGYLAHDAEVDKYRAQLPKRQ